MKAGMANMSSSIDSMSSIHTTRLPTNPRRRKVPPDKRRRTTQACNACNVRRVKCSGGEPCSRCLSHIQTCEYPPAKEKVVETKERWNELQERCLLLERCLADVVPSEKNREVLVSKWTIHPSQSDFLATSSEPASRDEEQETTDGRVLQDPDGYVRYLGESSGAAFIDRLREFVGTVFPLLSSPSGSSFSNPEQVFTSLRGRYHTHDSKPLLLPNVDPLYLPEPEEISKLVRLFRLFAGDGDGHNLHGGIYYWGDLERLEDQTRYPSGLADIKEDLHQLCNLNAIMAVACQYEPSHALPWETYPGETYFARAKLLLINPMEDTSVLYMRALCLMGHYLLGLYRRDAAFMYVGLAVRISVIHGLHKKRVGEEINKEFWNTFILDRWLSCLMGRPTTIPREAITVDLPLHEIPNLADREEVMQVGLPSTKVAGLRAHAQLALIMDEIVNSVYGIASTGLTFPRTLSRADTALQKLSSWYAQLPSFFQLQEKAEINDRASIILHMMYNQLILLCTRPSLFQAAKQAVAAKYLPSHQHRQRSPNTAHIKLCAEAARDITKLTKKQNLTNQAAVLANVDYHFPFSAAIVLQLVTLLPDHSSQKDEEAITFLSKYLQKAGERGNESAADCAHMVREFEAVAARLRWQPVLQTDSSSTWMERPIVDSASVDNTSKTTFEYVAQGQGIDQGDFLVDNENFFEGQAATYVQLFSWFIESPI